LSDGFDRLRALEGADAVHLADEGKQILLRQGDGLIEPGGQMRFDFEAAAAGTAGAEVSARPLAAEDPSALSAALPGQMALMAAELEEAGQLEAAAEMYRAAMAAGGPQAESSFQLAELLYRQGDLAGARERYYMAIELDEDYLEARANLGCVLAELGQHDLAVAAFQGALAYHGDYADVHYHLARLLDELGRRDEAEACWRSFLELAPDSPWAEQARSRLCQGPK
jgi:tetratricopeptide (TPR) repeat protein